MTDTNVKRVRVRGSRLARFSAWFFINWRYTLLAWIFILGFGAATYTTIIQREGFPPIQFPLSLVSGTYAGQTSETIDEQVTSPISAALNEVSEVTGVEAAANQGFFTVAVEFDESVTSRTGTDLVIDAVNDNVSLPDDVLISYAAIDPGSFLLEYDLLVQVYSTGSATDTDIDAAAEFVAEQLVGLDTIDGAVANKTQAPVNNGQELIKTNFSRIGVSNNNTGQTEFFNSVVVGVERNEDSDVITLSEDVDELLAGLDFSQFGDGFNAAISADFASEINQQIDFLESNMLTGLIAVAIVSFLLITWRASIITALFMMTVMLSTIIVLYLIGYTLNVITLFALILSLGLFVDDATIVVEAIDAHRRDKKLKPIQIAVRAVRKVGLASLAGTLTTVLVFAILASPTGILGEFIRLIPVTVILALLLSFVLSITFIPFVSRFLMLRGNGDDFVTRNNPILKIEHWLGNCTERVILSVRNWRGKLWGAVAILTSIGLVMVGVYVFGFKVDQNTFPPPKDADQLAIQTIYQPRTSIEEAEAIASEIENVMLNSIGDQVVTAYYGAERLPDPQQALLVIELIPFTDRDVKAPVLKERLEQSLSETTFNVSSVSVATIDNGPPSSTFPFGVRVYSDDVAVLESTTQAIADRLVGEELENFNGDKINVLESQIDGVQGQVLRDDGRRYAIARFAYDSDNPTLVSVLTEERFKEIYTDDNIEAELGVTFEGVEFDAGQEGDFQDSFATLLIAVPLALLLMYILLAVQFRSLMQPALILLAIPFTLFGVGIGMFVTDNAASFFVLTGFIGLIGIAVNNTIMLTDYANQERRAGKNVTEAIAAASRKRLRPLITTTLTTIVALLPLALSDPFWEALAFTIIFGLASSTVLVLLSFPYYYLLAEWFRSLIRRLFRRGEARA